MKTKMSTLVLAAGTLALAACPHDVGCPEGTVEEQGLCVMDDAAVPDASGATDDDAEPDGGSVKALDAGVSRPAPSPVGDAGLWAEPDASETPCMAASDDDPIDDQGKDDNCDGVDGVKERFLFVSPDGSDEAAGSPELPLRTLQKAIARALSEERDGVLVAADLYEECDLSVDAGGKGVHVYGGYLVNRGRWGARDLSKPSIFRTSERGATFSKLGDSVIEGLRFESAAAFSPEFCVSERNPIVGEDAPGTGASSFALWLRGVPSTPQKSVVLRHVEVQAGDGNKGVAGGDGAVGTAGSNGNAGCPKDNSACSGQYGFPINSAPDRPDCKDYSALPSAGHGGASRGNGYSGGTNDTVTVGGATGNPPGHGQSGVSGRAGSNGAGGRQIGALTLDGYAPATAGAGVKAQHGQGGGGGGGATSARAIQSCTVAASLSVVPVPPSGGTGATGGCGGDSGVGGAGGGASIGLAVDRLHVTLVHSLVATGDGGRGGKGGQGGAGGPGADGGTGGDAQCGLWDGRFWETFPGGNGGKSGSGGRGGHGGGGFGGPVIGVALFSASLEQVESEISLGRPGAGGQSSGNPGAVGTSVEVLNQK